MIINSHFPNILYQISSTLVYPSCEIYYVIKGFVKKNTPKNKTQKMYSTKIFFSPTQFLRSCGELALANVFSNTLHTLSLTAEGKDWAAEPPGAPSSWSHTYTTAPFSASSGKCNAKHRRSNRGTGGEKWKQVST